MGFLTWLEAGSLGEWVRASQLGYPLMIASHAIGMAVMVGLSLAFAMRVLGMFRGIPYIELNRFLIIAWVGFAVNFVSGSGLFAAQATTYITDGTFLLKMAFVFAGMILVAIMQGSMGRHAGAWQVSGATVGVKLVALVSIVCWFGGIVAGRLIAYL